VSRSVLSALAGWRLDRRRGCPARWRPRRGAGDQGQGSVHRGHEGQELVAGIRPGPRPGLLPEIEAWGSTGRTWWPRPGSCYRPPRTAPGSDARRGASSRSGSTCLASGTRLAARFASRLRSPGVARVVPASAGRVGSAGLPV